MSYSFSVKGKNSTQILDQVHSEMKKVVESQPIHETDREQAQRTVSMWLNLLREPKETENIEVSVSGSIWSDGPGRVHSVSINVSAYFGVRGD